MRIDIATGVIDFGNGLVVDPREPLAEFDRKVPRELLHRVGKVEDMTVYWFKNMFVPYLGIAVDMRIYFYPGEVLDYITIEKSSIPGEPIDKYYYVETHEQLQQEYKKILEKLLGQPNNKYGSYTFEWGAAGALLDNRTPDSEIKIRYKQATDNGNPR